MKLSQLKSLLKHIITEVENISKYDNHENPEFTSFGAVNVEENEEVEFQNGDKVRLKPPYAGGDEVFTLSQWDGRRGWIGDEQGRGWYVKGFQIQKVEDIEKLAEDVNPRLADICTAKLKEMGKFDQANKLKYANDMKELHSYLRDRVFGKDAPTAAFIGQCAEEWRKGSVGEQTGTGAVAGYSTPFAFKKKTNEKLSVS